jgi:Cu-processing system ATP-binding protein
MIEVSNVTKRFGKLNALKNVSATCNKGEVIALIGPNGCGKTTLIKSILGMVVPDEGDIWFDKKSIKKDWLYREHIGYMPQIGRYPENMSIAQVLDMLKDIRKSPNQVIDEDLYLNFKLGEILDKRMATLSGGTRQKVSAQLAFMFNPKVLILDEPTAGLDPLATEILKDKISKEKDKLILITSHILSDLDDVVTHVIYMQEGEIFFKKAIDQLKEDTGKKRLSEAIAHIMKAENTISLIENHETVNS